MNKTDSWNELDGRQKELAETIRQGREWECLLSGNDEYMLYNLSPIRRNILEWFDFASASCVLELDGRTGVLTELFCRRTASVTTLVADGSDALINTLRNKKYGNLEVGQGGTGTKSRAEQYDYVTMLGVSESFFESNICPSGDIFGAVNQYEQLLRFAKDHLKDMGKLLLAMDNRFGLQYWAGKKDGHQPKPYGGILENGHAGGEYMFSKKRLKSLLDGIGFTKQQWYYPVPDYRYPLTMFSEGYLPGTGDIRPASGHYAKDEYRVFDEKKAFDELCEEGLFEDYANSFLVICSL